MAKKQAPAERRQLKPFKAEVERAGLAYNTARDLALKGDLPYFKFGRAWYVDPKDVDACIERARAKRKSAA